MALIEKAETGKVWLQQWLAYRQQVSEYCVTGTLATSKDTVQDGWVQRALVVKVVMETGARGSQSLVFQYMQNGGIPIWSASQDGGCHSRTKRVACSMVVIWWQTTAWTWLWVSPESPQCSDRIDGMRPLLRVSGEPFKTSLQGLVVSLKNLSTVRLMVSLVKPLYKFKTSGIVGGSKFQHSGSSSGAVSCPASTSFGGADTRTLTWDNHVQSLGSVTWDVWRSRCGASRGSPLPQVNHLVQEDAQESDNTVSESDSSDDEDYSHDLVPAAVPRRRRRVRQLELGPICNTRLRQRN